MPFYFQRKPIAPTGSLCFTRSRWDVGVGSILAGGDQDTGIGDCASVLLAWGRHGSLRSYRAHSKASRIHHADGLNSARS
ncbi:MAG TPA: hypothetical protein VIL63_13410 [Terriglobales bacterium]